MSSYLNPGSKGFQEVRFRDENNLIQVMKDSLKSFYSLPDPAWIYLPYISAKDHPLSFMMIGGLWQSYCIGQ